MIEALAVLWLVAVVVLAMALTLVISAQAVHRLVRRAIGPSSARAVEVREPAQA